MKQILDCKAVRDSTLSKVAECASKCKYIPNVKIIQVGNREDSTKYVNNKINRCLENGIQAEVLKFDECITTKELIEEVRKAQIQTSAIIVQCPLPKHINEKEVMDSIDPLKDCDGLTRENIGHLYDGKPIIVPATAQGIIDLLDYNNINVEGMNILLIGRSYLVNMPLFKLLLDRNATVTIAHSKTKDLQEKLSSGHYDMIVGAIGKSKFLTNVKTKYIIDVGINVDENGKLTGDFDIENCECNYYTKTPGGTGLLTQGAVVSNILKCHRMQYEF